MDSDEDLPEVTLNSPRKNSYKSEFFMPDASVLAARRKIEDERDTLATRIIEQSLNDISSDTTMEISHFSLPDADKIAAERMIEKEKDLIIEQIVKSKTLEKTDPEIYSCIDTIQSSDGLITIPGENPGVDMSLFDYSILSDVLCTKGIEFIKMFFIDIYNEDEVGKDKLLSNILHIFLEMYSMEDTSTRLDDLVCHFFTICGIILDKQCRQILTVQSTSDVACKILSKVPTVVTSSDVLETLSELILKSFDNFHDRLHLSEHFVIKCKPSELNTNPKYFSTRLSKHILYKTLCSLVNYTQNSVSSCDSFDDLRKILYYGEETNKLKPYEQYILLKICNELYWMFAAVDIKTSKQTKSKTWIINFFNGLKCNTKEQKSADFFKVKNLSSKLKLLWQMDTDD